jgi:glycosyltransferase involved in cell wall biosynthesis
MPRRILYVHACAGMGGAPLSLLYLIESLDRDRFMPEVLFLGTGGEEVELYRRRGITTHLRSDISIYPHALGAHLSLRSLRPWEPVTRALQVLPSARRTRDFLLSERFDLVHLNTSVLLPSGLGAAWAGVPVVWHVRETLHPGIFGIRRRLVGECLDRCSDAIIAISRSGAAVLKPGPKIQVIPNFVSFTTFDRRLDGSRARRALGLPDDRPLVAMLGGVVHSKGVDVFLEAAARVRGQRPDALFVVAGYPPGGEESPSIARRTVRRLLEGTGLVPSMERRVRKLLDRHRLDDTVRFVGMRGDIPEMLAACTMLVWPATVSHFSRPVIEAGAMARPVIASDFPISRELVSPGETGLLVPPSNPDALANAIVSLLENPEAARRMGEKGYVLARERYDAATNVAAIVSVYDGVLEQTFPREGTA